MDMDVDIGMDMDMGDGDSSTYVFKPPFSEDRAGLMVAVPSDLLAETRCNVRS